MHETMLLLLLALVGDTAAAAVAGRFIPFARRHRMTKMMSTIRRNLPLTRRSAIAQINTIIARRILLFTAPLRRRIRIRDNSDDSHPLHHTLAHTGANLYYFRRPTTRRHYLSLGLLLNLLVFVFIYDTPLRSVAQRNQNMLVVSIALLWLLHQHEN